MAASMIRYLQKKGTSTETMATHDHLTTEATHGGLSEKQTSGSAASPTACTWAL